MSVSPFTAALAVLAVVATVAAALGWLRWRDARQRVADLEETRAREAAAAAAAEQAAAVRVAQAAAERTLLEASLRDLEGRLVHLAKWQTVADADARAAEILRDAEARAAASGAEVYSALATARAEAAAALAAAQSEADRMRADAREQTLASLQDAEARARQLAEQAQAVRAQAERDAAAVRDAAAAEARGVRAAAGEHGRKAATDVAAAVAAANARADAIVASAQQKAEALAGDAMRALQEAQGLERTVQALENAVTGYGNRYLVPGHSLLDDLAEAFGHTEAGQRLKATRDHIRDMVRTGRAATCDYVEPQRRETAIRFVVDAFNGKADTILARVKHDNAGTLQQELRDAYALVNLNGQAFRNARILEPFLDARLEELRWAAVAQELKLQERDEQRRIKEQIREEEKARREYERAMRDAAKEEELVRKAIAKAEEQLGRASEAQRATYEAQLAELASRLQAAEARNQRALSMAQQTRRGHVYVISNVGSFGEHVYKIGLTRRLDPQERIRELGDSSVPFEFDVHALLFAEDAPALEHQLHQHFVLAQVNKVNHRKEFFRTDLAHIRAEIEQLGLTAQWTMTAAAREYRETLTIEAAIQSDPAARDAWVRRQLLLAPPESPFGADEEDDEGDGRRSGGGQVTAADAVLPTGPQPGVAVLAR